MTSSKYGILFGGLESLQPFILEDIARGALVLLTLDRFKKIAQILAQTVAFTHPPKVL